MQADQEEVLARKFAEPFYRIDRGLVSLGEHVTYEASEARNDLERMMADPRFTSAVIARAMTVATENVSSNFLNYKVTAVNAYLQRRLTEEHVKAQQAMSRAAEDLSRASLKLNQLGVRLTAASIFLAVAALIGTGVQIWLALRPPA